MHFDTPQQRSEDDRERQCRASRAWRAGLARRAGWPRPRVGPGGLGREGGRGREGGSGAYAPLAGRPARASIPYTIAAAATRTPVNPRAASSGRFSYQ